MNVTDRNSNATKDKYPSQSQLNFLCSCCKTDVYKFVLFPVHSDENYILYLPENKKDSIIGTSVFNHLCDFCGPSNMFILFAYYMIFLLQLKSFKMNFGDESNAVEL